MESNGAVSPEGKRTGILTRRPSRRSDKLRGHGHVSSTMPSSFPTGRVQSNFVLIQTLLDLTSVIEKRAFSVTCVPGSYGHSAQILLQPVASMSRPGLSAVPIRQPSVTLMPEYIRVTRISIYGTIEATFVFVLGLFLELFPFTLSALFAFTLQKHNSPV